MFEGCSDLSNGLCTTFRTYISTLKLCGMVWAITLLLGFTVAYFLVFHVRSDGVRMVLFLLCTAPFLDLQRHPHDLLDPAARRGRAR